MYAYTTYFANLKRLPKDVIPISITRWPPDWYKGKSFIELAPSVGLLKYYKATNDIDRYVEIYINEVLAKLNPKDVVTRLFELSGGMPFALVCYEAPDKFCHRHIVMMYLKTYAELDIKEY